MKYQLRNNNGLHMCVTDFGCRIIDLWTPDRDGRMGDIVLGNNEEEEYENFGNRERFLGAVIGRYGNRIANGRFTLSGKEYELVQNNGANALHGGPKGFDMVRWNVENVTDNRIDFSYVSADGEEGYPGQLTVRMSYELSEDNELIIRYEAVTDKDTVVNLTHHSYFNLHGEGCGDVNDHVMMINASRFTPIDETLIPTGELCSVEGTPFDFRSGAVISSKTDFSNPQIEYGFGFDHNWVLDKKEGETLSKAAEVYDPQTGRVLEVFTTEPGMQFYCGNWFDGSTSGKSGKPYIRNCAFALETQHFPDSPNKPQFPSTVLRPGEVYTQTCIYKFSARG